MELTRQINADLSSQSYMMVCIRIILLGGRIAELTMATFVERGTTEELSKFWMPLGEFSEHAMKGLEAGDFQVFVPQTKEAWEAIEKGRIERCLAY